MTEREQRDLALARLMAEALKSHASSGVADAGKNNNDPACPDPEILSAYADRGLDPGEAAQWEIHFASCARCRKILAVLAVSAEEPLAPQEVERLGQLVAAATIPAAPAAKSRPLVVMPVRRPLRWLVPALGAAAAVALWFALRPATPPAQTVARNEPAAATAGSSGTNSPDANSEVAQAEIPPPPPTAPAPAAKQGAPQASRESSALKEEQPAAGAPAPAPAAQSALAAPAPVETAPSSSSDAARSGAPAPPASGAGAAQQNAVTVTTEVPVLETQKTSPGATSPPNAAASNAPSVQAGAPGQSLPLNSRTFSALARIVPTITFASPGGTLWRAGAGGRIERSTDQGRTWQAQVSGVTSDLVAGAAVSNRAAWIVGRAGVILRTTDGVSWQRVVSPNKPTTGATTPDATNLDWAGVQASDAQHATIVSTDQRRFTTADSGQTWTPQP